MAKEIKGNAGRRPPEPTASHAEIDDWTQRQVPHLQPIVKQLDETIRATIPDLQYAVKWKRPYYGPASADVQLNGRVPVSRDSRNGALG